MSLNYSSDKQINAFAHHSQTTQRAAPPTPPTPPQQRCQSVTTEPPSATVTLPCPEVCSLIGCFNGEIVPEVAGSDNKRLIVEMLPIN